jgi:hypothetical protein
MAVVESPKAPVQLIVLKTDVLMGIQVSIYLAISQSLTIPGWQALLVQPRADSSRSLKACVWFLHCQLTARRSGRPPDLSVSAGLCKRWPNRARRGNISTYLVRIEYLRTRIARVWSLRKMACHSGRLKSGSALPHYSSSPLTYFHSLGVSFSVHRQHSPSMADILVTPEDRPYNNPSIHLRRSGMATSTPRI